MLSTDDASVAAKAIIALAQHGMSCPYITLILLKLHTGKARKQVFECILKRAESDKITSEKVLLRLLEGKHGGPAALFIADLAEYLCDAQDLPTSMSVEEARDVINSTTISLLVEMLSADDDRGSAAADAIAKLSRYGIPCVSILFALD